MDELFAPGGCPERVWDGDFYPYHCGMGVDVCARHGRFRTLEPPIIYNQLRREHRMIHFIAKTEAATNAFSKAMEEVSYYMAPER